MCTSVKSSRVVVSLHAVVLMKRRRGALVLRRNRLCFLPAFCRQDGRRGDEGMLVCVQAITKYKQSELHRLNQIALNAGASLALLQP